MAIGVLSRDRCTRFRRRDQMRSPQVTGAGPRQALGIRQHGCDARITRRSLTKRAELHLTCLRFA